MKKYWMKLGFILVAVLILSLGLTAVVSAATTNVTVRMPAELAAVGAKISVYPWNASYSDGQTFTYNTGSNITWRLIVNGFTGPTTYNIVASGSDMDLVVAESTYCKMKVINIPTGGVVKYYPWNNQWVNDQEVILPMGVSITWLLKLNGFEGQTYTKIVDCTPLDVKQAWIFVGKSFCDMKVQMPDDLAAAGYKVNVYPWNTYWTDDQVITLPIGTTITWRLTGNGFTGNSYTKKVDCTPLVVNASHYCTMQVDGIPAGQQVNVYPWNTYWNNDSAIIVPIGGSCTWKLVGPGAPSTTYNKNFDCTPLVAGP